MGLWDTITKYASPALDLYNLYDSRKNAGQASQNIRASDPYLGVNQQAAEQLSSMMSDGGAAYMQGVGPQAALAEGNKAYYRSQAGGGDRLSTGAAERRETQAVTLYDQILNSQYSRLQGMPRNEGLQTGAYLSKIDSQQIFDRDYGTELLIKSLGNIFGGGSYPGASGPAYTGPGYTGPSVTTGNNQNYDDGWWQ